MSNDVYTIADLKVKKSIFTDEQGKQHPYNEYFVVLDNEVISFTPCKNKKQVCNYIVNKIIED